MIIEQVGVWSIAADLVHLAPTRISEIEVRVVGQLHASERFDVRSIRRAQNGKSWEVDIHSFVSVFKPGPVMRIVCGSLIPLLRNRSK